MRFNSERGEVPLTVGGVDLVVAAEMGGLAAVSSALKCQSFAEMYQRLVNVEIAAVLAGVEHLTVRGDVGKAMKGLTLKDLPACRIAFLAAMMHHAQKDEAGNADAAGGETTASPGGAGASSPSDASAGAPNNSGAQA